MNGTASSTTANTSRQTQEPQLHSENGNGFPILVGTFRSPALYTLNFQPLASSSQHPPSLTLIRKSPAVGGHSWLALSPDHTNLYTTCWSDPPQVAAYRIDKSTHIPTLLNTAPVASLSGYTVVTPSGRHLISVGGPTGEVFSLDESDGRIGALVQKIPFREAEGVNDGQREGVAHGAFGGLRWGSHSVDIAPDGRAVYVADIGHNCIWSYSLDESAKGGQEVLQLGTKHISPRSHDGPRHTWPHPNGRVLYCVQEHSSMVDAFAVAADGVTLEHLHGQSILPVGKTAEDFWADEVRTSNLFVVPGTKRSPRFVYGSTRGLQPETKGYVAAYELDAEGRIVGPAVEIFETRTSGGLANAIEPAPRALYERLGIEDRQEEEFIAITDSQEGWVAILGWNGNNFREVSALKLVGEDGTAMTAATAVWL